MSIESNSGPNRGSRYGLVQNDQRGHETAMFFSAAAATKRRRSFMSDAQTLDEGSHE
jgi:hypothetical protein